MLLFWIKVLISFWDSTCYSSVWGGHSTQGAQDFRR